MSNAAILDSVVSGMVSSYSVNEIAVQTRPAKVKVSKPRAKREPKVAPSSNGPVAPIMNLPTLGSLTAEEFILSLRTAGKIQRENEAGVMIAVCDSQKEKQDQIRAIAGFVGYDFRMPHGTQLDNARRQAQAMLRPMKDSKVVSSLAGFVAGMPNGPAKVIQDLQGRIRVSRDLMLDLEKQAEQTSSETERATKLALATVESERIQHMRKDLKNITG